MRPINIKSTLAFVLVSMMFLGLTAQVQLDTFKVSTNAADEFFEDTKDDFFDVPVKYEHGTNLTTGSRYKAIMYLEEVATETNYTYHVDSMVVYYVCPDSTEDDYSCYNTAAHFIFYKGKDLDLRITNYSRKQSTVNGSVRHYSLWRLKKVGY